ncbi:MAG: MaoC/PaaZ C-terminal domain-containing protein [Alphaproteobacteria bacterium]|jgi:hypothetical protein|nr:MaoC/PaaZ C-terminal domain-containing protein [Alphaproteobacteria bacterium]
MHDPYPLPVGYEYKPQRFTVEHIQQENRLADCGIDPTVHGDRVDLTFLGFPILDAMMAPGVPLTGQVHVYQRFIQKAPLMLGQQLHMTGRISAIEPVAKGEVVRWSFEVTDDDGRVLVIVDRAGLRSLPNAAARGGATDFLAPPSEDRAGFTELWQRPLTPERVANYSRDGRNRIHSDPEIAKKFGFRAPIAGGLMGVHYYLEAIAHQGQPDRLDLEIWFKRPMFWDETLTVLRRKEGDRIAELRIENEAKKAASLARLNPVDEAGG